jgi:hypothetical protein
VTAKATESLPAEAPVAARPRSRDLLIALGVGCLIGGTMASLDPRAGTDFNLLYYAAQHLLQGENPYPISQQWYTWPLYYPLTAVLVAVPFSFLPLQLARVALAAVSATVLAYGLLRYRGAYALLAMVSASVLLALRFGQSPPLITGASLIPVLGFLLTVKPNQGLALLLARPTKAAVIGCAIMVTISLIAQPSWPLYWWASIHQHNEHLVPLVRRPFGWLLLLAAYRWRTPEGRLLCALSLVPQTVLPYELVPLALIPRNQVEMGIYALGTWFAAGAAGTYLGLQTLVEVTRATWPVTFACVYLPMLWLVLRRPAGETKQSSTDGLLGSPIGG